MVSDPRTNAITGEYLATGFANVDARADVSVYADCLRLLDSLPYFQAYKRLALERLDLSPGLHVLDVGCGLGNDVRRIAAAVGPTGFVLGVDASQQLLLSAQAPAVPGLSPYWCCTDARVLPFADAAFDRIRIDRVLQHVHEPQRAIAEMARVLRPGGTLVVYDNDWGSFALASDLREATSVLQGLWSQSFVNPWIGRHLPRDLQEAGLHDLRIEPQVCVLRDLGVADRVYDLSKTLDRAVTRGLLSVGMARAWWDEQWQLSRREGFLCSLTAYLVIATKG